MSSEVETALAAWFNALPDGGMGKEHFDALLQIVRSASPSIGRVKPLKWEDAAKAAAQEDHERKILWQIVGSSDPDVAPPNVEHLHPLADREKSAALVSPPDNGGWMPIETAPKDGTWIIVRTGQVQDGRWAPFSDRCFVVRHLGTTERLGIDIGWTLFPGMVCGTEWLTHWQPLPSPPALQSHNEGSDGK